MNHARFFTVAVLAALACGSADAQNILGRLAARSTISYPGQKSFLKTS